MKIIKYLILAMFLITVGCSTETGAMEGDSLTQKDATYYKEMNQAFDELDIVFDKIHAPTANYIADKTKYKELNKPAEEARALLLPIIKKVEKIKPRIGEEATHKEIIKEFKDVETGLNSLIRLSNDKENATGDMSQYYIKAALDEMGLNRITDTMESIRKHKE